MLDRSQHLSLEHWRRRHEAGQGPRTYLRLADLLDESGRHEEALALLAEVSDQGAPAQSGLVVQGRILFAAGRPEEARGVLGQVLRRDPENIEALRLLAEDACRHEDWPAALPYLETLEPLVPDRPEWGDRLREVRRRHLSPEKPPAAAAAAGPPGPGGGIATLTLVEIYLAQGYRRKALAALRDMAAADPDRVDLADRIAELEDMTAAEDQDPQMVAGSGPRGPSPHDPAHLERMRALSARRRAADKEQFQAWVDSLRERREPQH